MPEPVNVAEFEAIARERLAPSVYDYYAGGADDERTLHENTQAFRRIPVRYRVLVDVAERDMRTSVFGIGLAHPIILAPTALHRMAHDEGELATARAAAAEGALMTLSTVSSTPLEDVADAADAPRFFQLYHFSDRGWTERLVARAEAAGFRAIVLTVDAPLLGKRERDVRHAFDLPEGVRAAHFDIDPRSVAEHGGGGLAPFINQPSINWKDIAWLKASTSLPLLIKGVVRADDAKRALDEGIDGLWVSNHGGRQLDTSITTAEALPGIVAAAEGRVPVIVDGGVRRGTDVLKGIALGADLVAIGRPQLWGLASGGEAGVRAVLAMLRDEFSLAMALAGCARLDDIDPGLLG
ncbi:MAG: alpha-hydroxy acid oxidase [Actinomycetota bacterium]